MEEYLLNYPQDERVAAQNSVKMGAPFPTI